MKLGIIFLAFIAIISAAYINANKQLNQKVDLKALRDDVVASAVVKFHGAIKIEDPEIRKLTLVQMAPPDFQNDDTSWFFAGKPSEGLIYKITQNGEIESLTWVPPFTYGSNQAKNLQVLLRDFKNQQLSNL